MRTEALLLNKLRAWRDETARRQGVESYRVFPNATLEAIALSQPTTLATLTAIKGIKEVKSRLYGKKILEIVQLCVGDSSAEDKSLSLDEIPSPEYESRDNGAIHMAEVPVPGDGSWVSLALTVSQFLDALNLELSGMAARIRGEVTSVDIRERVVYFTLKDKDDDSVLNCLIFRSQYDVLGVKLTIGDEVMVEGVPDIYKPSGRLSLRVASIEYAGEGALKKAYDELYRKLEGEGVFAPENKRTLPKYPERIALITSQEGAALGDFTMNLTRVGFQVTLYPSLVEGKRAVFDIIKAIKYFNMHPDQYDVLVVIRGGGSLESLQAFNTEALVQVVRTSKIPVLAGIGHERDVSLVALAADHMVSTPTATAKRLSLDWDEARLVLNRETLFFETLIERLIREITFRLRQQTERLREGLQALLERVANIQRRFTEKLVLLPEYGRITEEKLEQYSVNWKVCVEGAIERLGAALRTAEEKLEQYNPTRVLALGYSLVRKQGKLLRRVQEVEVGEEISIELGSGRIESEVKRVVDEPY